MDIPVVQGEWNAEVSKDAHENWQGLRGLFCSDDTNQRGLRLLEFATFNPFLPGLATAVLACWGEAAERQLQKTDS